MKEKMESNFSPNTCPYMSSDIRILAQAFLEAKKEFNKTGKSGKNNHQDYKYAKIEDIYNAVEEALSKQNIIIWHMARPDDTAKTLYLFTRLIHTISGQWIEDMRILESEKPGNQAKGAANTFMKKYAVLSLCAIATEDDDGEEEEKYIKENKTRINGAQVKEIQEAIKAAVDQKQLWGNIKDLFRINKLEELQSSSFETVLVYITKFNNNLQK